MFYNRNAIHLESDSACHNRTNIMVQVKFSVNTVFIHSVNILFAQRAIKMTGCVLIILTC